MLKTLPNNNMNMKYVGFCCQLFPLNDSQHLKTELNLNNWKNSPINWKDIINKNPLKQSLVSIITQFLLET